MAAADRLAGKTIRFKWTEGPTKGETHELVFGDDGTVKWMKEQAKYGAVKVSNESYLISFMGNSGYTLSVVVNFSDNTAEGFASGAKEWYSVKGNFEIVSGAKA